MQPDIPISIIVPMGPNENDWPKLRDDLKKLQGAAEMIFAFPEASRGRSEVLHQLSLIKNSRTVFAKEGRAQQLNAGVRAATKTFFWFVPADSRVSRRNFKKLKQSIHKNPDSLHYFNLWFRFDGPVLVYLNALFMWVRAHVFRGPAGDQGFCLSRKNFVKVGGFPEEVAVGEDHVFLRRAKWLGLKIKCTHSFLRTSARRYREQGWLSATGQNVKIWIKQIFSLMGTKKKFLSQNR